MRIALYARVSKPPTTIPKQRTGESDANYQTRLIYFEKYKKDQNPLNQLLPLREWAKNAKFDNDPVEIVGEFVDEISSKDTRPDKEKVLKMLRLGEIEGVAFIRLERWGRTTSELVSEFEEAIEKKWSLISLKESLNLNTSEGRLYARLLAMFAEFERDRIRERTIEGLLRARAQGKILGRPKKSPHENLA
jgi:DNA invertase Pin-like site-specific DNA recombinase